jgi:hypothetical protein
MKFLLPIVKKSMLIENCSLVRNCVKSFILQIFYILRYGKLTLFALMYSKQMSKAAKGEECNGSSVQGKSRVLQLHADVEVPSKAEQVIGISLFWQSRRKSGLRNHILDF